MRPVKREGQVETDGDVLLSAAAATALRFLDKTSQGHIFRVSNVYLEDAQGDEAADILALVPNSEMTTRALDRVQRGKATYQSRGDTLSLSDVVIPTTSLANRFAVHRTDVYLLDLPFTNTCTRGRVLRALEMVGAPSSLAANALRILSSPSHEGEHWLPLNQSIADLQNKLHHRRSTPREIRAARQIQAVLDAQRLNHFNIWSNSPRYSTTRSLNEDD